MAKTKGSSTPAEDRGKGSPERDLDESIRPRASRQETTKRILDAAEELFAARNPRDVTVREIAEKAGVTHALVHQYVGSKDDLLSAVIHRPHRVEVVRRQSDVRDVLPGLVHDILEDRLHSKALTRSAMDGIEYVSLTERIETGQALVDLARRTAASGATPRPAPRGLDPEVVIAAVSCMAFGWAAQEDWIWDVFDIDRARKEAAYEQVEAIASYMVDLLLVAPADDERA